MKAVIIGSGNVATHFGVALQAKGVTICQVYSRTDSNAEILAKRLNTPYTTEITDIYKNADVYIYAIKDSYLHKLLRKFDLPSTALHIHTSGSIPMKDFFGFAEKYGVLYPIQTFSKNKKVDFSQVPICVEAIDQDVEKELLDIAHLLTDKTYILNSEKRRKIHLAAVFACNFSNYMYDIAFDIVMSAGVDFEILKPLIAETANKIKTMTPREAQTGPAIRYDENIINKHISLLNRKNDVKEIYKLLTKSIHKRHKKQKKTDPVAVFWGKIKRKTNSFFSRHEKL
jgi:predicted short-subunit dehydrogenase-like oxidoreductase (DUF2520 family)